MIENKNQMKNATTHDVARLAGVNRASVSVVLNGAKSGTVVSQEKRERILAAAAQLGYTRNGFAAAMRRGRFDCIGLLMGTSPFSSGLPPRLWEGVHEEVAASGRHLLMARLEDEVLSDGQALPHVLDNLMTDGLLIDYTDHIPPRFEELIRSSTLPSVWLNVKQKTDNVLPDDFDAGCRAAEHLLALGHSQILFLKTGAQEPHYSENDRREGARQVLKKAGCEMQILTTSGDGHAQAQALQEILVSPTRPTAIIGYGVNELEFAFRVASQLQWQIPRDLSVVVFGEEQTRHFAGYEITQFIVPQHEVGQRAVRMLLQKIENPQTAVPPVMVRFGFQQGELCAPPCL